MAKVSGVKNHSPMMFTFDLMEANAITLAIVSGAFLSDTRYITHASAIADTIAQSAGRYW